MVRCFMSKILGFLKNNWLVLVMGCVIMFFVTRDTLGVRSTVYKSTSTGSGVMMDYAETSAVAPKSLTIGMMNRTSVVAPTEQADRMVVQETNMSMLVKDVSQTLSELEKQAVAAGGYMVNKSISKPEGAANGYISVRVPIEKRESVLESFRGLGVKVVSENVGGSDVTDQYVDIEGRIASLNKTKAKIEAVLEQATKVSDLMDVQMQLSSIEQQIDSYKGQQKYLEQTAKLTLISVNLSTDELSLPYAPDSSWRPAVVFKNSVRSMMGALRGIGNVIIWLVAYAPIWLLAIGAIYLFKKIRNNSRKTVV